MTAIWALAIFLAAMGGAILITTPELFLGGR